MFSSLMILILELFQSRQRRGLPDGLFLNEKNNNTIQAIFDPDVCWLVASQGDIKYQNVYHYLVKHNTA